MHSTARAKLLADFQAKKANGLKDMKFFLGKVSESTVEDVCAEVMQLYDAVAQGNAKVVESWKDSNRPAKRTA